MYYYIVDPQKISQKEFERVQNVLYSSLSEYKIAGEVVRVTGLRTIQQLVENAFAREAKTIVAVGSDQTLHEMINAIGKREVVVGFIPMVQSELANILGVNNISQAAKVIAFRRIEAMDLGLVNNNYYFLSKLSFGEIQTGWLPAPGKTFEIKFSADGQYQATLRVIAGIIVNSRDSQTEERMANPTDGNLDILFLPELSKWKTIQYRKQILTGHFEKIPQASVVHAKQIEILSPQGLNLKVGELIVAKSPVNISVVPHMLKMIVGRERKF
ncbi:MAG TPA: diacylglycerol kinase family protein [Patescibacteria group bacterium]